MTDQKFIHHIVHTSKKTHTIMHVLFVGLDIMRFWVILSKQDLLMIVKFWKNLSFFAGPFNKLRRAIFGLRAPCWPPLPYTMPHPQLFSNFIKSRALQYLPGINIIWTYFVQVKIENCGPVCFSRSEHFGYKNATFLKYSDVQKTVHKKLAQFPVINYSQYE